MNILVTGAKGMVGQALVANLKNIRDGKNRTRSALNIEEIYEYDIVEFSQRILYDEPIEPGDYGDLIVIPRDLFEQYENQILPKYNILICGLNKTRDYYNYHIRKDILHKKTLLPESR